jgi:hypothetical protein
MPKSIKINQYIKVEERAATYSKETFRVNSITTKSVIANFFSGLLTLGIIAITILSYYSEIIYFTNIILGLSIVGLTMLIKKISEQKTSIKRYQN